MAETSSKRQRDETEFEECENPKRCKSYNHILSILEGEEEEGTQDLSPILTTFQQELSAADDPLAGPASEAEPETNLAAAVATSAGLKEDEEEDREGERVMRHLLEASDDELGIPHRMDGGDDVMEGGSRGFSLYDGLWELEDEAANYYTLLQSELFM